VRLLPGAADAVERLRRAGYACVVVTNQSGVGRGLFTEAQMHAVNDEMHKRLRQEGTQLDGLYYCTVAPIGSDKTTIEHPERKPGPGMLLRAARELKLDLARSWAVGDSVRDVLAARHAGCAGAILVRTGHDVTEAVRWLGPGTKIAQDLAEAANMILESGV
jgi:D-glycero-D-manno-heptose 1,7-bisphosphate phosphatase